MKKVIEIPKDVRPTVFVVGVSSVAYAAQAKPTIAAITKIRVQMDLRIVMVVLLSF